MFLQFAGAAANKPSDVPVMLQSRADAVESFHNGAIEFLEKPFGISKLLVSVRIALSCDKTYRELRWLPPGGQILNLVPWGHRT